MPLTELSQWTLQELGKMAEPFVDKTPDDVVKKIIKAVQQYNGGKANLAAVSTSPGPKEYGAGAPPNLSHTKVLSAELNGLPLEKANWNRLLDHVIIEAADKLQDPKALKHLIVINYVQGRKEDQGYHFLPAAGVSVQGQDANGAWKGAVHIIKAMKFSAEVVFVWYDNPKATNPGQSGKFTIAG